MYAPLAANLRRAVEGYSDKDLQTLTEFVARLRAGVADTTDSVRKPARR